MALDLLLAALGLVILLLAGDALVRGAVNMSLRIGIPAMIVSLTIVAFGTSAPELLISVSAILDGAPGLALGNVVGSNIANVLLVLGLPAVISVIHSSGSDSRTSFAQMIAATVQFVGLALTGPITWVDGLILLAGLTLMLGHALHSARGHRRAKKHRVSAAAAAKADAPEPTDARAEPEPEVEGADPSMRWWKIVVYLALGLAGLPLGANLLVDSSIAIATALNVPDTVIGLTLVAVGTSLPELATTVIAALRRQADVALGNVIGSNMFNLLGILGVASLVGPIPVDPEIRNFDLWVMLGASLLLVPFVWFRRDMGRRVGLAFCALYGVYLWAVVA
ncbi:MAG: sodium:proton exchanger [Confluentimicrobium sp.]|nr:sodium:proton exchanger [Actibacterium sp.]